MFYIVIPTINGEINGDPVIIRYIRDIKTVDIPYECTVYFVDYLKNKITKIDI